MQRYVGVDLGIRTKHRVAVLDDLERRGKPFSIDVTRAGFEQLLQRATEGVDGPVKFVMEPTGLAWVPVAAFVSAAGHQVYLVKSQKASHLRKFLRQHTKTDCVDADAVARLPQVDSQGAHPLSLPTAEQMALSRMVKRRERLADEIGDNKRRIKALMVMANPPLTAALGEAAFGEGAKAFLRKYSDPEVVVREGLDRLRNFWHKPSKGKVDPELVERVFEACKTTVDLFRNLRQGNNLPFDYQEIHGEISADLDLMDYVERQVEELNERIAEKYQRLDPNRTLEKIPGIGAVIAPAIEALVGNIGRFRNARKFIANTGLCPRKKQSGNRDQAMPMTKAGNRILKKYFYLAAETARRVDPDFARYYARRYAQGDQHNRIMIALARKLALRVYAILKRREQARRDMQKPTDAIEGTTKPVPVEYVLRDSEGNPLNKKEARTLIAANFTRAKANPQRHQQDQSRRGRSPRQKKTEDSQTAKVEWPSQNATSGKPAPPSSISLSSQVKAGKPVTPQKDWESVAEIIRRFLRDAPTE